MNRLNLRKNSMFFKLIGTFVLGIALVTIMTLSIVLWEMENRYVNSFCRNTTQIIKKNSSEMRLTGDAIINLIQAFRSNWALQSYISDKEKTSAQASYTTYNLTNSVKSLLPNGLGSKISVLVVGTNGVTYSTVGSSLSIPFNTLLESDFTRDAKIDPSGIHYKFFSKGFTGSTINQSVLVASAAIVTEDAAEPFAFIYVLISQEQLRDYYRELSYNMILLLDESGTIISSLNDEYIGQNASHMLEAALASETEEKPFFTVNWYGRNVYGVSRPVNYWGLQMIGVNDSSRSIELETASRFVLITSSLVAVITIFITSVILRRITLPLKSLAMHMGKIRSENFTGSLPLVGEWEIKELISAYNYMLDDMNNYISQLTKVESQKRNAEIKALQSQIKPHFIYNTLTSVKWLIWRGENDRASQAIDSFTHLIKNMIEDESEMIPVRYELENLKYYTVLQQIRFGDQIKVLFNIDENCLDAMIPKLILQPFIENAFFHAYPNNQNGIINVFINKKDQTLIIEIIDYGIGLSSSKYEHSTYEDIKKQHRFKGIGISNVDERVRMMFGNDYYVTVKSESGKGTIVKITLPYLNENLKC